MQCNYYIIYNKMQIQYYIIYNKMQILHHYKSCNATITLPLLRCKYYIIINLVMQLLHHPPWRDENPPKFYSIIQHLQPSGHVNSPPHEPTCVANIFCTFAMRNGTCSRGAQDLHAPLENYIKFQWLLVNWTILTVHWNIPCWCNLPKL